MIFGIGLALCIVTPILHGTFEPKWGGFWERLFVYGFLFGLFLIFLSIALLLSGAMP